MPTVTELMAKLAEDLNQSFENIFGFRPGRVRQWVDVAALGLYLAFAAFFLWLVLG